MRSYKLSFVFTNTRAVPLVRMDDAHQGRVFCLSNWKSFLIQKGRPATINVVKAATACEVSGHVVSDHFVDVNKTINTTQAMKAQRKVPDNRPLVDFAPTIILKAKDFATEITIFNARQHSMTFEAAISHEHITDRRGGDGGFGGI